MMPYRLGLAAALGAGAAGSLMLATLGPLGGDLPPGLSVRAAPLGESSAAAPDDERRITGVEFARIAPGTSHAQVTAIVGDPGQQGTTRVEGTRATARVWRNADGSSATVIFRDDRVVLKTQGGL